MSEKIKESILIGNFNEAEKYLKSYNTCELREFLIELCYETENIIIYSFICNIISKKERAELHFIASEILSMPLCHINGAYNSSLFHARKAIELDPYNIEYKEYILLFYNIPEKLISKGEAEQFAREVINKTPDSRVAYDILNS